MLPKLTDYRDEYKFITITNIQPKYLAHLAKEITTRLPVIVQLSKEITTRLPALV